MGTFMMRFLDQLDCWLDACGGFLIKLKSWLVGSETAFD